MKGWIVFLAGIGLMVSEIVTKVKPTLPPGQKHPHQLLRYESTAYTRVLVLGIVSMLARNLALWGRFWFALGLVLVVVSSWAIYVTLRHHQSGTSHAREKPTSTPKKMLARRIVSIAATLGQLILWTYSWKHLLA